MFQLNEQMDRMYRTILWLAFIKSNETSSAAKYSSIKNKTVEKWLFYMNNHDEVLQWSWTISIQDTTSTIIMNGFSPKTSWASSWDGRCKK